MLRKAKGWVAEMASGRHRPKVAAGARSANPVGPGPGPRTTGSGAATDSPPAANGCAAAAEQATLSQVLTATYWLDPGETGPPYPVAIKFTGRRLDAGTPGRGDRFEQTETVVTVLPGSGPVSITTRVRGLEPGDWLVRATPVVRRGPRRPIKPHPVPGHHGKLSLTRMLWSKGNPLTPAGAGTRASTRMGAFAAGPGIIPASWSGFVAAGVLVALVLLAGLMARLDQPVGPAMAVALGASVAGAVGSRVWYLALKRGEARGLAVRGLCIQGFIAGVVVAGLAGLRLTRIPAGVFLDAAAPGLFFAMTLGRQGCFFTGCCEGRPTTSRFGVWSSDGRIGVRRVPAQLLESLVCLLIGAGALVAVLRVGDASGGAVFVGATAVYTIARQVLLAFRAEPRKTSLGRPITIAAAAAVALVVSLAIAA